MQMSLGTQLRHLVDLADGAVGRCYAEMGLAYRPRYTPIMQCLIAREPISVGEIARCAGISQPAATQTVSLMIKDDLITRVPSDDGRQKLLKLSAVGRAMVPQLQQAWDTTARAALSLDKDLELPLSSILAAAIEALRRKSFTERIREAALENTTAGETH